MTASFSSLNTAVSGKTPRYFRALVPLKQLVSLICLLDACSCRSHGDCQAAQRERRECTSKKLPCALAYASLSSADTPCVRRLGNARESDYCVQVISVLGKPCKHKYVHFLRTLIAPTHTLVHGRFTTCTHACINCIPA